MANIEPGYYKCKVEGEWTIIKVEKGDSVRTLQSPNSVGIEDFFAWYADENTLEQIQMPNK